MREVQKGETYKKKYEKTFVKIMAEGPDEGETLKICHLTKESLVRNLQDKSEGLTRRYRNLRWIFDH